jgi:glycosyltransferase involved in cell wall biosynthesis
MSDYDFELLFVNDGSKDQTLNILKSFYHVWNYVKKLLHFLD